MPNEEEQPAQMNLTYRRYVIVNIKEDKQLIPHLCLIVEDDDNFREAAKDPHFQFIIKDTGAPVRRGSYVPLTLVHGHTFASEIELERADKEALKNLEENPGQYVVETEDESLFDMLFKNLDNTADSILSSLSRDKETITPSAVDSSVAVEEDADETLTEYDRPDLNTHRIQECVDGEWVIEVPTPFIALSHLIHEAYPTDAPAFLIASSSSFVANKSRGYSYDDFDFVVEYEDHSGPYFSSSVAELTKLREGEYIIQSSNAEIGEAAAIILDKIIRIAVGDMTAIDEASEFMEDFSRIAKKDDQKDSSVPKPKSEDTIFHTMLNLLIDLYNGSSTENLFNTLHDSSVLEGYEDSIEDLEEQSDILNNMIEVERLFDSQGLQDLFRDMPIKYEAPKIPFNAKEADLAGFYSTPLTPDSFPESMKHIAGSLDLPFIYENSILDNDILGEVKVTSENAGELFMGMIIAMAVRYQRLKEIQNYGLPLIPFNVFLKIFQDTYQANYVNDIIVYSVTNIPKNGTSLIRELALNHMPAERQERAMATQNIIPGANVPLIVTFPSVMILHCLNHMIFDDGVNLDKLVSSLYENNPLRDYVAGLSESLQEFAETAPFGKEACPELIQAIDLVVNTDMTPAEIADAVIDLLTNTAMRSAADNTDFKPGSPEWQEYLTGFYEALLRK